MLSGLAILLVAISGSTDARPPAAPPQLPAQQQESLRELTKKARTLENAGEKKAVDAIVAHILADAPSDSEDGQKARVLALRIKSRRLVTNHQFLDALTLIDEAHVIARQYSDPDDRIALVLLRVLALRGLKRPEDAIAAVTDARTAFGDDIQPLSHSDLLLTQNAMAAAIEMGQLAKAKAMIHALQERGKAILADPQALDPERKVMLGSIFETRGALAVYEQDWPTAERMFNSARNLYLADPIESRRENLLINLDNSRAIVLQATHRQKEALSIRLAARKMAEKYYSPADPVMLRLTVNLLQDRVALGDYKIAKQEARRAIDDLTQHKIALLASGDFSSEYDRALAANVVNATFGIAEKLGATPDNTQLVLDSVAEWNAVRALPAALRAKLNSTAAGTLAPLLHEKQELDSRLNSLLAAGDMAARRAVQTRLAALASEIESAAGPALSSSAPPLARLQAGLDADAALLIIAPVREKTHALLVRKNTVQARDLGIAPSQLCSTVEIFRKQFGADEKLSCLTDFQGQTARATTGQPQPDHQLREGDTGRQLYARLIAPFAPALGDAHRLHILAGGSTAALPWAALQDTHDEPLIASMIVGQIATLQTITHAFVPTKRNWRFLGIGDPCLGRQLAEGCDVRATATTDPNRSITQKALLLPPLPHAAEQLANDAKAANGPATILTGRDATLKAFRAGVTKTPDIIDFATHALPPSKSQPQPALLLSPKIEADHSVKPQLLDADMIAGMDIPARLVILSACSTASDSAEDQTGTVSGFIRAFMQAGTRGLLVTHGNVLDGGMAKLMPELIAAYRENGGDLDLAFTTMARHALIAGDKTDWVLLQPITLQ